jgi:hypothetical protein
MMSEAKKTLEDHDTAEAGDSRAYPAELCRANREPRSPV